MKAEDCFQSFMEIDPLFPNVKQNVSSSEYVQYYYLGTCDIHMCLPKENVK